VGSERVARRHSEVLGGGGVTGETGEGSELDLTRSVVRLVQGRSVG